MLRSNVRRAGLGGVIGPAAFIGSWAVLGLVKSHYSPLQDPISDLAGVHASTRAAMTTGFVVFSGGMGFYSYALRAALPGPAWMTAAATGAATLGVAAFPLHHSSTHDHIHGAFAAAGYITLAATALLSGRELARIGRRPALTRLAFGAGVVSAISLALTLGDSYHGLFQRLGLTAGDVWIITSGVAIWRGSLTNVESTPDIAMWAKPG